MKNIILSLSILGLSLPMITFAQASREASSSLEGTSDRVLFGTAGLVRYNHELPSGAECDFDLPTMQLAANRRYELSYDLAYACRKGYADGMSVLVSTNHGLSWSTLLTISGKGMSTVGNCEDFFLPDENSWQHKTIALSGYSGDIDVRFHFVSDNGNNLYLDNIRLTEQLDSSAENSARRF